MKPSSNKFILTNLHEASPFMLFSLSVLAVGSIFFGFIFKDLYVGLGSDVIFSGFGFAPTNVGLFESEFLPFYIKNVPFIVSCLGVIFA
jgi:NADH-ubiquinone oxidoreductase chain 5